MQVMLFHQAYEQQIFKDSWGATPKCLCCERLKLGNPCFRVSWGPTQTFGECGRLPEVGVSFHHVLQGLSVYGLFPPLGTAWTDFSGNTKPMVCQTYGLPKIWFAKPMVCQNGSPFTKTTKITKMTKTTKTTQTAMNKDLCAGLAEITETTEMTKSTGIRGANHGFSKQRA